VEALGERAHRGVVTANQRRERVAIIVDDDARHELSIAGPHHEMHMLRAVSLLEDERDEVADADQERHETEGPRAVPFVDDGEERTQADAGADEDEPTSTIVGLALVGAEQLRRNLRALL